MTELNKYIGLAKDAKVAGNYMEDADLLSTRMNESITVQDIYKEFCEYPMRFLPEYKEQWGDYPTRFVYYEHTGDK